MLPLSVLMSLGAALSIGQGIMSHRQQTQAAHGQEAHNALLEQINHQNALNAYDDSYFNNYEALQSCLTQEQQAIGQKLVELQRSTLEVAGNAKAHAAASGLRGMSLDSMMRQLSGKLLQAN